MNISDCIGNSNASMNEEAQSKGAQIFILPPESSPRFVAEIRLATLG
jgi:hypothetical protein